ncbi:NAD(P)-dependent oxidoreductase [Lachnospiraceae bacterium MD1]|uniref:NAD(P)-dependent oxidoreductase n=1 Tax=Variimorphobacter saccharofermentans TaxID=2755051 RepID=A0A839K082_9FIRM|nr:NAD(P)-dependent oxidoreductase [Variimorphobacter saccharofermentans]MBB2182847.1 NAD(P)-dependent oxidoreductase [Variimorphobacter saccharofermentans]
MGNAFEGLRVLVTGATGLIGSYLVRRLLSEGAIVIATGRKEEKLKYVFKEFVENSKLILYAFNISYGIPDDLGELDYVFHAASPISGDEIKDKPVNTIEANIFGTRNCLEYIKKQGETCGKKGKVVIFSSATVYGTSLKNIGHDLIVNEENTDNAEVLSGLSTPYSESKRMVEVMAYAYYRQYGVDVVVSRISYVYGYIRNYPKTAFYEFINNYINNKDIVINNGGMARRDNIFVEDVINGLLLIAKNGISGEAYNISSNGEKNNYLAIDEIAEVIIEQGKLIRHNNSKVIKKQPNLIRLPGIQISNEKIKSLGWEVNTDIYDGIKNIIMAFYKEKDIDE